MKDDKRLFYYTWSGQEKAQREAKDFACEELDDFHFLLSGGQRVLDLTSISCQASFGHRPQFIHREIQKQWDAFPVHSPKADFVLKRKVSRDISDLIRMGEVEEEGKVFYCVSGSEAIENAIKMARLITGKKVIAARKKSYHGATLGANSLTGDWRGQGPLTVDEWTLRLPEPCEDIKGEMAREIIMSHGPSKVAAICLETITAVNGVIIPERGWYQSIQQICDEFNIKLILDEVACGLYRTGKPFAFQHYAGLRPNFVCMAKAITGGMIPFGALWTDDAVAMYFEKEILYSGSTNYAHPLGLAACHAVIDYFKGDEHFERLAKNEETFNRELEKIRALRQVKDVRSIGLMANISYDGNLTWHDLIQRGLYLIVRENQLFLAPPLNITPEILSEGMQKLAGAIAKVE